MNRKYHYKGLNFMKALVKYSKGEGNIEIREMPEPYPGPGEVKIEVKAAGICGTDIHIYHEEFKSNPPVILGHEFCGAIAEVGENVTDFKAGDRVTSETAARVCGKCLYCKTGNYNLCPERLGLGCGLNGAFTKYCVVRQELVHFLPDNVDFISGALCEPLSCTIHGVIDQTHISAGDIVAITGPGAIGLLSLQLSKLAGAFVIILGLSADKHRLSLAKKLGADVIVNVEEEDPEKIIKKLSKGYGADVILECSGAPAAAELGLKLVRKRGQYTQMGLFGRPIHIDFEQIAYKELQVSGFVSQNWTTWERALNLLGEGKIQTRPLVTDILPITDWKKGFEKFEKKKGIKIILLPVE
jgi:L-iditol 2-dehydrogenase